MRIVHLLFEAEADWIKDMIADVINRQAEQAEVSLFIITEKNDKRWLQNIADNVHITCIHGSPHSLNPIPVLQLNRLLKKRHPHFIHCHNPDAIKLLKNRELRNNTFLSLYSSAPAQSIKRYNQIFAISNSVTNALMDFPASKIIPIRCGIDIKKIAHKSKYIANSIFKIVQLGELNHKTNKQQVLIKAVRQLLNRGHQNIHIDFIGDGPSEQYLRALTLDYQLEQYITFTGYKYRTFIQQHLCKYDLLVQPSAGDCFSIAPAEAMAAGVPVLLSNTSELTQLLFEKELGFFFLQDDHFSLAETLEDILSMPDAYINTITENARLYAEATFNLKAITNTYKNTKSSISQ